MRGQRADSRGWCVGLAVVIALSLFLSPTFAFAADAAQTEKSGLFNRMVDSVAGLGMSLKNVFSEITPADVGSKPRIRPHFSTNTGFTSNADIASRGSDAAFQAKLAPGVAVSLPVGPKWYNEVDYTYTYGTTQGKKITSNTSGHSVNVLSRYDLTEKTVLGATNNIQWSETPDRLGDTYFLETANAELSHRFTKKLTAKTGYIFQYYDDPDIPENRAQGQDFTDNVAYGRAIYDVLKAFSVGPDVTVRYRNYRFNELKDYGELVPGISVGYRLGSKTNLSGNVGYAYRDYDIGGNETEITYGAGVNYAMSRKLAVRLKYQKSMQDTFNSAHVLRQDNPDATVLDTFDPDFRLVKVHRIDSSADYYINEKNSMYAYLSAQFVSGDATDNVVTLEGQSDEKIMESGVRYSYRLTRYLSFDIGYSFGRRFSSRSSSAGRSDFTVHKANAGVNLAF